MKELIDLAIDITENCYSPYSEFYVGCVLVTKAGKKYTGVNIENSSYPNGSCAEKNAFIKAVGDGERDFSKLVIVGGKNKDFSNYCYPCGSCRQFISEFCGKDFEIVVANNKYEYETFTLQELLKKGFVL